MSPGPVGLVPHPPTIKCLAIRFNKYPDTLLYLDKALSGSCALSTSLRILPVAVSGKLSVNRQRAGTL
jgi:hypothetical protein